MLGLGKSNDSNKDSLPILVNTIQDLETFSLVQKLWDANSHNVRIGSKNNKEYMRFGLVGSKQAVWLERNQGRKDSFEMILVWEEKNEKLYYVFSIVPSQPGISSGDSSYAKQILNTLLSTPATLPVEK